MFRTRYIRSLIIAAAAVAAACTADPVDPADPAGQDPDCDAEPASLTINFSIADIGIGVSTRAQTPAGSVTRADAGTSDTGTPGTLCGPYPTEQAALLDPDNPPVEPSDPNDHEGIYRYNDAALVNGSLITNLTVILVNNRTNRIVGVRRLPDPDCPNSPAGDVKNWILKEDGSLADDYLKDENGNIVTDAAGRPTGVVGTRACVTFDYEAPVHIVQEKDVKTDADKQYIGKSAEKLLRGEYTVLAVANYDHRVTTSSVTTSSNELVNTLNIDTTLEEIANEFHKPENMANGITFAPEEGKTGYRYFYNVRFLMNRLLDGDEKVENWVKDENGKKVKPYIRPAVHQTLTVAKEFTLTAGDNHLDLELLRITSRTRVEVKNYSSTPLKVHSLEFSRNYTQSTCYLFRRNKDNRDYSELATKRAGENTYYDHDGKGAPMVGYTGVYNYFGDKTYGAIVPFVKDWDSDGDGKPDGVKVDELGSDNNKRCIFDALMYESHVDYKDENHHDPADPDSFTYTIDVSYPEIGIDENGLPKEKGSYKTIDPNKIDLTEGARYKIEKEGGFDYVLKNEAKQYLTGFSNVEALRQKVEQCKSETEDNECYFLIQGFKTGRFLQEAKTEDGTGRLYAQKLKDNEIKLPSTDIESMKTYLWKVEIAESGVCKLINLNSGRYLPCVPPDAEIPNHKTTDADVNNQHTLEVDGGNNAVLFATNYAPSTYDYNTYYLNVFAEGENLGGWHGLNDDNSKFLLYPVKLVPAYIGTPRMKKTVELTAFSDATGYVEKVREIQRNDFVRILVEVSYNPDKSDFMFKVNPWDKGGGTVEFH